jgi:hypothetical protein
MGRGHNQVMENNHNWKGGVSLNNYEYKLLQKKKYPEKFKCRDIYYSAKRYGKIEKKPCEVCGNIKVDGHHDDYTKPLEVKWLCRKHHLGLHKELRDARKNCWVEPLNKNCSKVMVL